MYRKTRKSDWYVCAVMFIISTGLCIYYELWFVLIAYATIAGIIILFLWVCKRTREYPDKRAKKREEHRTEKVVVNVYEVIHGINNRMQPYTQILCQYEDDKKRKICFKSEKILGKVKVMVGDKCMVYYDPNDTNNCIVIPQVNSK